MRRAASGVWRRGRGRGLVHSTQRNYTSSPSSIHPPIRITTLPNKIRVATDSGPGHFASVGLYVNTGSRFEVGDSLGASNFLDRMAFKSTFKRSEEEMMSQIHSIGGQIMASSSREAIMYQSSHSHKDTPLALSLIADTALNPNFLNEEVDDQRDAATYELREISSKPEMILPEILHGVAYDNQGLGNQLLCPADRIQLVNSSTLKKFMAEWYCPERMLIAGAGVEHESLVELVDKHFGALQYTSPSQPNIARTSKSSGLLTSSPSPSPAGMSLSRAASFLFPNSLPSDPPSFLSSSTYTGGYHFIHDDTSEFDHLYIAYEGVGIHDDDIYALATIQALLGGGGSFSAGGPGKGMYTRLYTHILNYYAQIEHCAAFHHIYTDSSLLGLFASFVPSSSTTRPGSKPQHILPHLAHQLSLLLYQRIPDEELRRAKNQLMSSMIMAMESQNVQIEDMGRQILVHNRRIPVTEMTDKIDKVGPADMQRVAMRIFGPSSGNKPTVVGMGHEDVGDWQSVFKKYGLSV